MGRAVTDREREFARNLHENMRQTMERNGWGISKFCAVSGIARSTLVPIYNGDTLPNSMTLYKIAQTMGLTISEAIGETSAAKSRSTWYETVGMIADGDPEVKRSLDVLGHALADGLSERAGRERAAGSGAKAKKMRCVETGETFSSIKDASARTGISRNYLSAAARAGRGVNGLHYEFVD